MSIQHTAADLARSQAEYAAEKCAAEKCSDTYAALQARQTEKQQALNIIQQRRIDGGECDGDAATVALLALDCEGLRPLVETAQTQHQAAVNALQAAQITVQQCQARHEAATAESAAQALESRLHELEELLLKGLHDLHTLKRQAQGSLHLHGSHLFVVSPRLVRFATQGVLA